MDNQLTSKGWHLSEDGLKACQAAVGKESATAQDIIKTALKSDLRQIARKILPENINNGQVESINGPLVLQIQKVRNVSAPIANQESRSAPRMMKLNLTDGCTHCVGIEFANIAFLNMNMVPGTKVCLSGCDIPVVKGCILLDNENIKLLGGEVETLKAKWEASKQVATSKRLGKANDDPPPAFTEFDSNKPRSRKNTQKRNNFQDYQSRDEMCKDTVQKQAYTKKSQIEQKVNESSQERNQKSEVLQKKSAEKNQNFNGKIENRGSSDKNEYKTLWNSKKNEQAANNYKDEHKKGKSETYKEKKGNDIDNKNWGNDPKLDSSAREKDKERSDLKNKNEQRGEKKKEQNNKRDQQQDQRKKSYDGDRDKKIPQDYRGSEREKKPSQDYRGNEKEKKTSQDCRVNEREKKPSQDYRASEREKKTSQDYRSNEREKKTSQDYKGNDKEKKASQDYRVNEREKKPSQDYRVSEKKFSNDWSNEEYDRKVEKKKDEKDLWLDEKSKEQKDKYQNKKGKISKSEYDERGINSNNSRNPTKNKEQYPSEKGYRDDKSMSKDYHSDKRAAAKGDYEESRRADNPASKSSQNSRNSRSYNDKTRKDRDVQSQKSERHDYDSKYDKRGREQSREFGEKHQWKDNDEEYYGEKDEIWRDGKKPVAYDASSHNWVYDGETKVKKEDTHHGSDMASIAFKEGTYSKKDNYNRSSYRDNSGYHSYHNETKDGHHNENKERDNKRNNKNEYPYSNYRGDNRFENNKKDQKSRNYKTSDKIFSDRDQTNEKKDYHQDKANNKKYNNRDYTKDTNCDYNYRDRGTSDYIKDDNQLKRQQVDEVGSVTSDSSKDTTASVQGQKFNDNSSKDDNHSKCIEESNSKYSPGKRIPLEVLFGKNMKISNDSDDKTPPPSNLVVNIVNKVKTTNVVIPDQETDYQPKKQYSKTSSREIMERSLEQKRFNQVSQPDYLYMSYAAVNQPMSQQMNQQINQQIQYPYQQTLQPVSSIQVSTASQYIGYANEHNAAVAATVNPYLSYHTPRANFQYNQIHTQHPQHPQHPTQQQTQNLASDVPYYTNNAQYYYQINNPITQLPEQYQ